MIKKSGFHLELLGDVDLEGMVIILCYDDHDIAEITYEKGIDKMEIEFAPISEKLMFPLNDFSLALEKAKQLAIKCAKEDVQRDQNI